MLRTPLVKVEIIINQLILSKSMYFFKKKIPIWCRAYLHLFIMVKAAFLIIILSGSLLHGSSYAQKVTLKGNNMQLQKIFLEIRKQTGYDVISRSASLDGKRASSIDWKDKEVSEALDDLLKPLNISYEITGKNILILNEVKVIQQPVATYFSACSRGEVEPVFEKSADERITDTLSFIKNTLVGSEFGWVGYTTTDLSGGFGFYFDFDEKDRVKMVADINNTSASAVKESTYRVRQVMAATLSFDTYNYLTMLQDPTPGTLGGSAGKGFGSDVEFEYIRNSGDTLFFQGRKFKKDFILIKASAEDQSKYTSGEYLTSISTFKDVFNAIKNAYIEVDFEGQTNRVGISMIFDGAMATRKSAIFTYVDARNNAITRATKKIAFLLGGIVFLEGGVKVYDFTFVSVKQINAQTLAVYDSNGNEYVINESSTPIIPLNESLGSAHSNFRFQHNAVYPGTSDLAKEVLDRIWYHLPLASNDPRYGVAGKVGTWFTPAEIDFTFQSVNNRLNITFRLWQNANGPWTDVFQFGYTTNEDKSITLTRQNNGSSGYVPWTFEEFSSYLHEKTFNVEFYEEDGATYAKYTSQSDPGFDFTMLIL